MNAVFFQSAGEWIQSVWNAVRVFLMKRLSLPMLAVFLIGIGILILAFLLSLLFTRQLRRPSPPVEEEAPAAEEEPDNTSDLDDERFRRLEEVVQAQSGQISAMESQLDDAAKLRHDFRQQLLLLQGFVEDGNRQALEQYLPELKLDTRAVDIPVCQNILVNTIYKHYFAKAKAAGIEMDVSIQADADLWLSASDVGVLFGNLLDNSITAAAEAPEGCRLVRIRTVQSEKSLIIAIGNTFGTPRVPQEDGSFASTKAEHTGIGLRSIQNIAETYEGGTKFVLEGDMFMSYVILFRPMDQ